MNNILLTICCGEEHKKLSKITIPSFVEYAKKINIDFECITEQTSNRWESISLKRKTKNYIEKYDRVLFVDIDSYISPFAPNIFEEHPDKDKFYIKKLPRKTHFNINSGVFISSNIHKKAFDQCELNIDELKDLNNSGQSIFERMLCQQLNDATFEVEDLKSQWHMYPSDFPEPFYIFHAYAKLIWKKQLLLKTMMPFKIKI